MPTMTRGACVLVVLAVALAAAFGPADRARAQDAADTAALVQRIEDLRAERDARPEGDPARAVIQGEIDLAARWTQLLAGERALPDAPTPAELTAAEQERALAVAALDPAQIEVRVAQWRALQEPTAMLTIAADADRRLTDAIRAAEEAEQERNDTLLRRDTMPLRITSEKAALADARADLSGRRDEQAEAILAGDARLLLERRLELAEEQVSYHVRRLSYLRRLGERVGALARIAELAQQTAAARRDRCQLLSDEAGRLLRSRLEEAAATAAPFDRTYYELELDVREYAKEVAAARTPADDLTARLAAIDRQMAVLQDRHRQHVLVYSGKSAEPPPGQKDVLAELEELKAIDDADREATANRRRERLEATAAVATGRQSAQALQERFREARASARSEFDAAQAAGTVGSEDWAAVQERRWQALAERVDGLASTHTERLEETVRLLDQVLGRRQELSTVLAETVALLRRENLFLRGESAITLESVGRGVDDLKRLPDYLSSAGRAAYDHLTAPGSQGPSTLILGVLGAVLLLLLRRRLGRALAGDLPVAPDDEADDEAGDESAAEAAEETAGDGPAVESGAAAAEDEGAAEAPERGEAGAGAGEAPDGGDGDEAADEHAPISVQIRAGLQIARAACVGGAILIVPFLAGVLLPGTGRAVSLLLQQVSVVLGGCCALWLITGVLFPQTAPSPLFRCDPRTATLLRGGLRLLLLLTIVLVPLGRALRLLEYRNEGVIQLVWAVYGFGVVVALLLFVLRRSVVLDMFPMPVTGAGRFARFWLSALHPVVLLIAPAVLVVYLLDFTMLAEFITRLSVGIVGAVLVGHFVYRILWGVLDVWLRSVLTEATPPAPVAASTGQPARDHADDGEEELDPDRGAEESPRVASVSQVARFTLACIVTIVAVKMLLWLQGATLEDIRAFLSVPLPFQSDSADPTTLVTWWNIVAGAFAIGAFVILNKYVRIALDGFILPRSLDHGVRYTIGTIFGYVFVGLGLYLGLRQVFHLENLGWIVAALSVGIGFGLQEIISNFVSGLILLFERPLKVGDMVKVGDVEGFVERINIRSTAITTLSNVTLLIPNKDFITQAVVNYVHGDDVVRFTIPVGVAYGSDTTLVRRVLLRAARAHPRVLRRPRSDALFVGFGDSSLDFVVRIWIERPQDHVRVESDLRLAIDAAFRQHGVEIPFPQRDLHLRSVDSDAVVRTGPAPEPPEDEGEGKG